MTTDTTATGRVRDPRAGVRRPAARRCGRSTSGYDVVGFDVDDDRVAKRLARGESYVEDVTDAELAAALASGRFRADRRPRRPAPASTSRSSRCRRRCATGRPTCRYIEDAARDPRAVRPRPARCVDPRVDHLPRHHRGAGAPAPRGRVRATRRRRLPPRLQPRADRPRQPRRGRSRTRRRSCPASTTPRSTRSTASTPRSSTAPVPVAGAREAELTKLLENTFRHVNIALVNELAMFADELGIDVWEAIDAASTKPFGFMRFTPGPGVGGHCLPIDPSLPVVAGAPAARAARSASSSWPTTSTSTCPTTSSRRRRLRAQPAAQGRQRQPDPAARPGLQEEHRRRPRVAGRSPWPSCLARPRRRGARPSTRMSSSAIDPSA